MTGALHITGPRGALLITALTSCASCSNGRDFPTSSATIVLRGTMQATVSGVPWVAERTARAYLGGGALTIIGESLDYHRITLFVIGFDPDVAQSAAQFDVRVTPESADSTGFFEYARIYQRYTTTYSTIVNGSGLLRIASVSADSIVGTFSFSAWLPPTSNVLPRVETIGGGAFRLALEKR